MPNDSHLLILEEGVMPIAFRLTLTREAFYIISLEGKARAIIPRRVLFKGVTYAMFVEIADLLQSENL